MTIFLVCAAVVWLALAVVHVLRRDGQTSQTKFELVAETPYSWAALVVAAAIPLIEHLPSTWYYSWPFVAITPFAALGVVHACRDLIRESANYWAWQISLRTISLALLIAIAVMLALSAWAYLLGKSPHRHPLLRLAEQRHQRIDRVRSAFELTLASMQHSLAEFEPPLQEDAASFIQIKTEARALSHLAESLLAQYQALVTHHDEFIFIAGDAPDLFLSAAGVWRQYAKEEREVGFAEIAERYDEIADLYESYADVIDTAKNDPLNIEELHEIMRFIRRAHLLLARLAENTPPSTAAEVLDRRAELEAHIRFFVERFDQLRMEIKDLTRQVRRDFDDPHSDKSAHKAPSSPSPTKNTLVKSVSLESSHRESPRLIRQMAAMETARK